MILSDPEIRERWPLILIGLLALLLAFSAPTFSLPFIYRSVIDEFNWTREQATLLATFKFIASALSAIVMGKIIDVIGTRKTLVLNALIGACAMISFLWIDSLTSYYAAGVFLGVSASGTVVSVGVFIARAFGRNQGFANGVSGIGASAGAVLIPFIIGGLIHLYEWRIAMALLSLGVWLITLPMFLLFVKDDPPTGHSSLNKFSSTAGDEQLRTFLSQPVFWYIAISLLFVAAVDQGIIQHTVLFLEVDVGITPGLVITAMSLFGVLGIIGKVAFGWVYDRISVKGIILVYILLSISSLMGLMIAGPVMMFAFIIIRGFAHGGLIVDVPILAKHVFGPARIGRTIGLFTAVLSCGFALGPWIMGRLFDIYGNYTAALVLFAVLSALAALLLMPVKPVYWLDNIRDREHREEIAPVAESV